MNSAPYYIICGPFNKDHGCTYWSMSRGWIGSEDFYDADIFPVDILTLPLPVGSTGVMAFKSNAEPIGQFNILSMGGVGGNIFEKTY